MKIAITGHRPDKLDNDYDLTGKLIGKIKVRLQEIIEFNNPSVMICGMALGIDTLWAELAIENKIPLIAAVPFEGQESKWPEQSKKRYRKLISMASVVKIVTQGGYAPWKMQVRNEWMVNELGKYDVLIAVWDGSAGGTYNCYKYADNNKKLIIRVDPNTYR